MVTGIQFGTFYFFAACALVALVFACLFVPETKGVPLEDMGAIFGPGVSVFADRARVNYREFRRGLNAGAMAQEEKESSVHVEDA